MIGMSTIRCVRCQKEVDSTYKACPYCGEAITDFLRRYMVEPIDGKYEIIQRLGAGGMGEVYKVRHKFLNALRVIKLIRPQILDSSDAHERFLREARAATRVQHPNVATLHDFSELPDGSHYMVWEYIDGENLAQRVRRRGVLPPSEAVRITIEALHGLDAIHRAGIVHRDISPENIMITRDENRVKIIDLGVAKVEEADQQATRTGIFLGKLRYASPEHLGFLPEGEKIDGRADLYSVGIVLYEVMTGRPPFEATSPHEYLMHHSAETPMTQVKLDAIPGGPGLQAIVARALERDRNKRFNNAREFAGALEEVGKTLAPANDAETVMGTFTDDATVRMTPAPAAMAAATPPPDTLHRSTVRTPAPPPAPAPNLPVGVSTEPGGDYGYPRQQQTPQPSYPQPPYPPPPQQTPYPQQQQYQPYAAAQTAQKKSSILPWMIVIFILLLGTAGGAAWYIKKQLLEEPTRPGTQVAQNTTSPATQSASMANVNVTVPSTTSAASSTTETTASTPPTITEPQTNTIAPTPQPQPEPQPVRPRPRPQPVIEPTPQPAPQPAADTAESDASDEEPPANKYLKAQPFVEGGDGRSNDYAIAEARRQLTGLNHVAIAGGADPTLQMELASLLRRNGVQVLPSSDIVVHFDGAVERLQRGRKQRSAHASITRKGRVVFRYEMAPEEYRVGDDPAEALARVLSNIFGR